MLGKGQLIKRILCQARQSQGFCLISQHMQVNLACSVEDLLKHPRIWLATTTAYFDWLPDVTFISPTDA